jgi:hypothetical protein
LSGKRQEEHMGLFDSYFDPQQFQDSGGLLGRLLSLQQQQGQYQPDAGFDPQMQADGQTPSALQAPLSMPMAAPTLPNGAITQPAPQAPDYGQTRNIAIGDYQMPQFGNADALQGTSQQPGFGDRLSAGVQSWAQTPVGSPFAALANGIAGFGAGQRTDAAGIAPSQVPTPTQSPDLGDRLSAGFQSWAHTPVGNPIAALANGIARFSAGQRTDAAGIAPSQIPSQSPAQPPGLGDRLSTGFQNWAHTPLGNPVAGLASGIAGLASGQRTDPAGIAQQTLQPRIDSSGNPQQDLNSQYQALRPILGDQNAMLAIVHPEFGRTLITQALARQTKSGKADGADTGDNDQPGLSNETNPAVGGQPPSLAPAIAARKPSGFASRGTQGRTMNSRPNMAGGPARSVVEAEMRKRGLLK